MSNTFEQWLEEMFIAQNEVGGRPINKDNVEDLFSTYLENLDGEGYLKLGTVYGQLQFLEGEKKQIKERLDKLNKNE